MTPRQGRLLSTHQAAVDRNDRPGHIVGHVGSNELDDFRAILRRPEPQRDQLGSIPVGLNAARNDCLHDPPGGDHYWGNAVRGDPEWPEIR